MIRSDQRNHIFTETEIVNVLIFRLYSFLIIDLQKNMKNSIFIVIQVEYISVGIQS